MSSLIVNIGQIGLKIICNDKLYIKDLNQHFKEFLSDGCDIDYVINVSLKELPYSDDIDVTVKNEVVTIDGGEFKGWIDQLTKEVKVCVRPNAGVFNSFLRVFYSLILVDYDGALLHAAAVLYNKEGYVFAGKSSAGKTTTARRVVRADVLNDELVLIRLIDGHYFSFSTPFRGEYQGHIKSKQAILSALFFLNKDLNSLYKDISSEEALISLMECVFFFDQRVEVNQKLLSWVLTFIESIRCAEVNTFKKETIEEVIDEFKQLLCA